MSYLQAWIKHYYPLEFWCVALQQSIKDNDKLHTFIMSANNEGIEIKSIDIFKSEANFSIHDGAIYCGYTMAKGVGEKRVAPMLESRNRKQFTTIDDFLDRIKKKEFTAPKTLMVPLIKSGAMSDFGYNTASLLDWYERFAKKKAKATISSAKKKLMKAEKEIHAYIDKHPEKSAAIAAALGAALGAGIMAAVKKAKKK